MNAITFTVPGVPVGKGRPRFARRGAHVATYTPAKTVSYENLVKHYAFLIMAGRAPLKRPIALAVDIYMPIPASWSKKRHQLAVCGLIGATTKPDWDNVSKLTADALNGIIYDDDKQIVRAMVTKQYGLIPRVEVRVQEYEKEAA
jgi:Holliday junction resolvase RusA-like endonuclease